jgi:hypothetical protein
MMHWSGSGINIGADSVVTVRRGIIKNLISQTDGTAHPGAHGFYWRGKGSLVEHVIVDNVDGKCVRGDPSTGTFRYNICKYTADGSFVTGSGTNWLIHNNVFWNTHRVDISGGSGHRFINNTVYGVPSGYPCIRVRGSSQIVRNNIFLNCGSNAAIHNESSGSTISQNLTSGNPSDIFTDPAKGDFSLRSGSPAINAGAEISGITCYGACDQGAYEYGSNILTPQSSDSQPLPPAPGNLQAAAQ